MPRPGFRSVVRTRVLERIAQACAYPVALIVAPAGYGKSVALRQYLDRLSEPFVRFDVRPEHTTLPSFVRAFAESLGSIAPHMVASLPDALRGTPTSGELAAWFNVQLKGYRGLIVVDDLQFATATEISQFLRAAIDLTKGRARWLLASRSMPDLPIASWTTYEDMDLAIDESDLAFTVEEARAASAETDAGDDEIRRFVEMTSGWATALNFALRMRVRTNELASIGTTTRDMVYRYLAEQVYDHLSASERELLHFAAYLPEIDVDLLIKAGFSDAFPVLEWLRVSAAFLSIDGKRRYRCHDLFRDFLRHQVALLGKDYAQALQLRVARTLIDDGQMPEGLRAYIAIGADEQILHVLAHHGFALVDTAHGDIVDAALESLPARLLAQDPLLLCLRAIRESDNGRYDRSGALFQSAMRASDDVNMRAVVAARYATDLYVLGQDASEMLEPFRDAILSDPLRASIFSQLAQCYATTERADEAYRALEQTQRLAEGLESETLRVRILYRIAGTRFLLQEPPSIVAPMLTAVSELAAKHGVYVTEASALNVLAKVALFHEENQGKFEEYCAKALAAAEKSGNRFSIQHALLNALAAQFTLGDRFKTIEILGRLRAVPTTNPARQRAIAMGEALLAAWDGDFARAYELSSAEYPRPNFDNVSCNAKRALYAIACGKRDEAVAIAGKTLEEIISSDFRFPFGWHMAEVSRLLCAAVEAFAGRLTASRRILHARPLRDDRAIRALRFSVQKIVDSAAQGKGYAHALESLDALSAERYGALSLLLRNAILRLLPPENQSTLTDAERLVLSALDRGRTPKEIAAESNRSIHTVRTLIQRATEKLGCSGRQQTIAEARRRGLLETDVPAGRSSASA